MFKVHEASRLWMSLAFSDCLGTNDQDQLLRTNSVGLQLRKHKQTESLQMSEAGPSHMQSRVPSRTRCLQDQK